MNYNKIYEGIIEIPNFISTESCQKIINILENISEDFWLEDKNPNWNKRNLSNINNLELNNIKKEIEKKLINIFDYYYKFINQSVSIQRITPNTGGINEHQDNINDPDVEYAMVLYYNDNYIGGQIEYPKIGVSYKPKTGSLLIHRGEYLHKVNEVKESTRYMSTFFIHGTKNHPVKIKGIK